MATAAITLSLKVPIVVFPDASHAGIVKYIYTYVHVCVCVAKDWHPVWLPITSLIDRTRINNVWNGNLLNNIQ